MYAFDSTASSPEKKTASVPAIRDNRHVPVSGDVFTESSGAQADPILDADARHRLEFARYAIQDGHQPIRDTISRLYEAWNDWNLDFFYGQLLPPHFLLAEPQCPSAFGDYSPLSGWGSTHQIRIRPSILDGTHPLLRPGDRYAEGRFRFARDAAFHETVHQYATEILKQPEASYRGHGPVYRNECNRIGALEGLTRVRTAKARGKDRLLNSCAQWPICERPRDYYLGAYRPHDLEASTIDVEADELLLPPEPPKQLADWIAAHPEWAKQFCDLKEEIFALLDRFFEMHPAPKPVQEQAVMFLAKSYRHRVRTRATCQSTLPATIAK